MLLQRLRRHNRRVSPAYMVFIWFGLVVLGGTFLLWLPWSHTATGGRIDFLTALFTAVSAACVTGLSTVVVADTFSFFGQLIIFLLMETGGMGIMTFATLGFRIFGRRLSLSQQAAVSDAIFQNDAASEFRKTFMQILKVTLFIQAAGAIALGVSLIPRHWQEPGEGAFMIIWSAMFHSASAFCNSGFTLYSDSLDSLRGNIPFLITLLLLITLGGLGHSVLHQLYLLPGYIRHNVKLPHWLSLHTKVSLSMTGLLIALGIVFFWILGTGDGGKSLWQAIFQTVSGRTAGFSIVDQARLPLPSLIVLLFLMFVGGSPGSCAGGIKTTSLAIWIARIKANLHHDHNVNIFGYTIAPELVSRARILMAVTMIWNVVGVFILSIAHPDENLQTLIFEQISASGTVGLSMNFTPKLTILSKLWIITTMFVGRLGPLSVALWVLPQSKVSINRPIGRIMVG